ncbi:MAG TPA: condensation domain-containing protein, partial [Candidatus Deferrimicrobium sp.]|nr:condensation domain-containing protein [Candidatus Deferrimicrobium sp.]
KPGDRVLQLSDYAFDGSVFDIFGALSNGLPLVMVKREDMLEIEMLCRIIKRERITVFFVTTALFNTLIEVGLESLSGIRKVLFGGERVSVSHAARALAYLGKDTLVHVYGPTETTVYATYYAIREIAENQITIPIGAPISNTSVYILDLGSRLTPIGVNGEIYIGGSGVCKGYLNNEELTGEKFLPNPFQEGEKFYRTGDLGRWLPDGNIEFNGRIDQQVKVRGYRIELGEIEKRVLSFPGIKECVVTAREDEKGGRYLCAYLVVEEKVEIVELKDYLVQVLPDYMIPGYFVPLRAIPLKSTGKVDHAKLPDPRFALSGNFVAPRDEVETKMMEIWSEVLGIGKEMIGIDDNFFQLGGHSLKATILVSKIHKEFDVKVPLAEIFKTPRIRELAEYIQRKGKEFYISIEPAEEKEYYELSPAQKRLYILQQLVADNSSYNIPYVIPLDESVEKRKLEAVFKKLIERHESLRTSFITVNEEPFQKIHREVDFSIDCYEIEEEAEVVVPLISGFVKPFNLGEAPLMRVNLINAGASRRFLFIDMHHILTDGTSQGILQKEFRALLKGETLQPLHLQCKDYSEWYNNALRQKTIKKQEYYWLKEFSDELPVLDLPTDYPRPSIQGVEGNVVNFRLNARETGVLKAIAKENEATLYMTLLAIFNILLAKLSGQEDIIIGTPIAARRHADLEKVIGMLVNTLAMRNYPSGDKAFKEFLREVRWRTLDAYENQEYPFEVLVDKITVNRDAGRNPVFDVMFNLLNQADYKDNASGQNEQASYLHKKATSKFDMNLTAMEIGERLFFTLEYSTRLFKPGRIERIIGYYKNI